MTDSFGRHLLQTPAYQQHLQCLQQRWEAALAATGMDLALVWAGTPGTYFADDQHPPFRANPHLQQWLPGQASAHALLLVQPGQPAGLLLHTPEDFWHLPPSLPVLPAASFTLATFSDPQQLQQAACAELNKRTSKPEHAAFIGPVDESPMVAALLATGLQTNPQSLLHQLNFQRAWKTEFELAAMRLASARAAKGHLAAREAFHAGASEFDIHMAYLRACSHSEAELPYPNIIALNAHAGTLHYQHYDRTLPAQRLSFLIDAGASCLGYGADISRTYAAESAPQTLFAELIVAMDQLQQSLVAKVQPGLGYADLHLQAHQALGKLLAEFKLVQCSAEAAFEQRLTDVFLPHGLGHLLGLQTHDVGGHLANAAGEPAPAPARFPFLRLTRTMAADQVFTVEPGLYFIPLLLNPLRQQAAGKAMNWPLIDALLPFGGIRIEDNVRVTATGTENFTRDALAAVTA